MSIGSKKAEQKRKDEIAALKAAKDAADKQMVDGKLPNEEKVAEKIKQYRNVYNEGGYGYVPRYYSQAEYERICTKLKSLEEGAR